MTRFVWLASMLLVPYLSAGDLTPVKDQSVLAAITRKAGALKGLAHNHFIYTSDYKITLQADGSDLTALVFAVEFPVESLVIDEYKASSRWYDKVSDLAGLEEPFEEQTPKNRKKVRKAMLGKKQLDAAKHPTIKARMISVAAKPVSLGKRNYSHELRMEFDIHSTTIRANCPANLSFEDGKLILESEAALRFSDFGIKPYTAMLGAVANQDDFFLYIHLVAQ